MKQTILLYALALAIIVFVLEWLEYQSFVRSLETEIYIVVLAIGFTALGAWAGIRITRRGSRAGSADNAPMRAALGITEREYRVLELLAEGHSNKELARELGISPNTVKTHLASLYQKIGAERRTQAIGKARKLGLLR